MASSKWILLVCVIWAVHLGHAASSHHSHAPAPSPDCLTLATTLADCLSFVANGSTATKPQGTCCPSLKTVLKTAPSCLCEGLKSTSQFGIKLNFTKALTLPAACKLPTPSFASCGLSLTPSAAPGPSPTSATASPSTGNGAPTPSQGNAAPALIPFSAGSLILCLLVALIPF
ncbi:hypothetical protein Fmac_010055 [Flemingia macrophylla]|uniref:Bifunctional inhibitor/plant lipid transfer protein/seed storage helical domain-containing protein n=1 Tax=Flemingia macrophylla TaxID=520843 RepID=A0ABD1N207_9FABA